MKQLYEGTFNWYGEVIVLYRYATKTSAFSVLTRALAKQVGYIPYAVRQYFNGTKDRHEIKLVTPVKNSPKNISQGG